MCKRRKNEKHRGYLRQNMAKNKQIIGGNYYVKMG